MNTLGNTCPAGAEHDPRAPWNQRDPEECEACDGSGYVEDSICRTCGGYGHPESEEERRERVAEERADFERDLRRDEI